MAVGIDDKGDLKRCGVSAFAANGKRVWHFPTDSAVKNNIAAGRGAVVRDQRGGLALALDEASGKLLWKAELGREHERWEVAATTVPTGWSISAPIPISQRLRRRAVGASGKRAWEQRLVAKLLLPYPTVIQGSLLVGDHSVVWAGCENRSSALEAGGKFNGCLAANGSSIAAGIDSLCAGTGCGKAIWTGKEKIGDTASAPALAGEKLVVGTADGRVCAFSVSDGSLLWSAQTDPSLSSLQPYQRGGSDVNSSPAILGDKVYVGASDGEVHAFALADGTQAGSYRLGAPIASSPFIDRNTLYIGGYDGNLYAFAVGASAAAAELIAQPEQRS